MAVYQAYFDESGKFRDRRVISFCGLCSPPERVREFEDEWKALLRRFGLRSLSMKRALKRKVKLSEHVPAGSAPERSSVLEHFAQTIRKHFELGIGITVVTKDYEGCESIHRGLKTANPHYFAFLTGLIASVIHVSVQKENRLSLICDDDQETARNCYELYRESKLKVPDIHDTLVAITFAEDDEFVPLQAADLVSSLYRLEAARRFCREYYEYPALFRVLTAKDQTSGIKWSEHFWEGNELSALTKKRGPVTANQLIRLG